MIVHKSHSKKDLVELFDKLGVGLNSKSTKTEILINIDTYINESKFNDKIRNKTELLDYLKTETPKQRPDMETKNYIMFKAKKVIKWANEGYFFNENTYLYEDEPLNDIMIIYKWGDIPSVRRACKFYNNYDKKKLHINPIISEDIQKLIHEKSKLKRKYNVSMKQRRVSKDNPIILSFD